MLLERGRVVAIEADAVWVETIRRSTCAGCSARSGCGHGVLARASGGRGLIRALETPALRAAALASLPQDARIGYAPQSPSKHRVTVFTAVDCGYCRRFHADIDGYLARGIAVDYVMIPLAGPGSEAERVSKAVYCASDRQAAFTEATMGQPVTADECESRYSDGVSLAQRLGITSTPTIVGPDGKVLGGYLAPAQLEARLLAAP